MASGTIHFTIEGEALTNLARTLWADELQMTKAIRLLVIGIHGVTEPIAMEVLTGAKKFIGSNNDLDLVDDGATHLKLGNLLAAEDVFHRIQAERDTLQRDIKLAAEVACHSVITVASPWGACCVPMSFTAPTFSGGRRLRRDVTWEDVKPYAVNQWSKYHGAQEDPNTVPDRYISHMLDLERLKRPPKPAVDLSGDNGWIAPNGDFFICGPCMHDALSEAMGFETVKDIEGTHIRVSVNPASDWRSSIQFAGRRKPTQAQRDKVWDWCQLHKEEFPKNIFD